jgi:predicted nuclease of predicted toxin-antitoxin system
LRRVLFDENMPRQLRREMPNVFVRTVQEQGWAGLRNGELLRLASGEFDVFLTADQRLRHQQNIHQFTIGVVVIETFDTTLPALRRLLPEINGAVATVMPGEVLIVELI